MLVFFMVLKKNGGVSQAFNFQHAAGLRGCERPLVCVFKLLVCIEGKKRRVPKFQSVRTLCAW